MFAAEATRRVAPVIRGVLVVALIAAAATAAIGARATGQVAAPAYPAHEVYRPSPVPDRTILTPSGDPAVEQSVTWRTDMTVTTPQAQIAKATGGPGFTADAATVIAETSEPVVASLGYPARFHSVRFKDLTPDTQYLYRVGDGSNWTEWFEFTTASDKPKPFSFIYYGDAQNDIREHVSRVFRHAFGDRPEAKVIVHAGDLVNTANVDAEWGEWFSAAGFINGQLNSIATPGNHEYSGTVLAPYWRPQFTWPDNGPDGDTLAHQALEGTVYYVDYQDVRFISLNSNRAAMADTAGKQAMLDIQAEWLRTVLADNPNQWTVVTFHHPVWSNSVGRNNAEIRNTWLPVLEEHNVDLVLQGHDHSYGRGVRAPDPSTQRDGDGPVYVVSVSGPKMYETTPENWESNGGDVKTQLQDTQLYQLIDINRGVLRYEARTAAGALFDRFVITKNAAGTKSVTGGDMAP